MEAGHLVSDDIILGIMREELAKPEADRGVLFDGVVRTIPQAEGLASLLAERGRQLDQVLFLDVSDAEMLGRLEKRRTLEGRADDDPRAVAVRLEGVSRADRSRHRLVRTAWDRHGMSPRPERWPRWRLEFVRRMGKA